MNPKTLISVVFAALALASAPGCGASPEASGLTTARGPTVSRKLESYVQDFVNLYGHAIDEIPISVGPLEKKVAGICYYPHGKDDADKIADSVLGDSTQPKRRVVISTTYFNANRDNEDAIQNVVFHELGHCILGRGHDRSKQPTEFGERPTSIMYPSAFGMQAVYAENRDYYYRELFQHTRPGEDPATDPRGSGSEE